MAKWMTPNQVVALNLRIARELRGWTQEQAAEALEPHLGTRWSVKSWSAAERSAEGVRVREFSADELVAFARTFDMPVAAFFTLAPDSEVRVRTTEEAEPIQPSDLIRLVYGVTRAEGDDAAVADEVRSLVALSNERSLRRVAKQVDALAEAMRATQDTAGLMSLLMEASDDFVADPDRIEDVVATVRQARADTTDEGVA